MRHAPLARERECSVGVMAYNEEANIADALTSILGQRLVTGRIAEVIVVASGCEDRTGQIVVDIARREPRVCLIEQERREGKASAVNVFINAARSPVLAMVGADVLVRDGTLDALVSHFEDPTVGMVGGHPTPVNSEASFLGYAVHLQWRLHDRIARESPKLGEIVAFRNVIPGIPLDTAVDEVSIEALITGLGYRLVYEPDAIVYNRGPATIADFLRQRRRIHAGHLRVREQQGYSPPTMSVGRIARALWGTATLTTPRAVLWSIGTVGLEATARALGQYDVMRNRSAHVWEVCDTTKRHVVEDATASSEQSIAVFNIVDFHRHQLEVGLHASRQLTRRVAEHVKETLHAQPIFTIQQSGTIIAALPGDAKAAERTAREIVRRFEVVPLSLDGHGASARVALAYGIVAFAHGTSPLATSLPVPLFDVGLTA